MNIAFDAKRLFNNKTGLGNYSRTLVRNMKDCHPNNQYTLIAPNTSKSDFLEEFSQYSLIDPQPRIASFWRSWSIYKCINNSKCDIYHGVSNELPLSIDRVKAKTVVTIHDLFYHKFPQDFSRIDRKIYKEKTEFACRKADVIIAISEATKQDIVDIVGIDSHKIQVAYQSCSPIFQENFERKSKTKLQVPDDYFLYVGTINKRKNLIGIIEAMSNLPLSDRIPLVVVGAGSKQYVQEIREKIARFKLQNMVIFYGHVDNNELLTLYKHAKFFCLPSFYEGFGIPIIESLFAGTPVLTSNLSALPEAAGNSGLLIDPYSSKEMSDGLQKMTCQSSFRKELTENIPTHIYKFSSVFTANVLNSLYLELASN